MLNVHTYTMWTLESALNVSVCTYNNMDSRNTVTKGWLMRRTTNNPGAKFLALEREEDSHDLPRSGELIKGPPTVRGALLCPGSRLTANGTSEMGSSSKGDHTFQQQQGPTIEATDQRGDRDGSNNSEWQFTCVTIRAVWQGGQSGPNHLSNLQSGAKERSHSMPQREELYSDNVHDGWVDDSNLRRPLGVARPGRSSFSKQHPAWTCGSTSRNITLNLNEGPVSPEIAALYSGPDDQEGSRRSLATWLHDPASIKPKM